MSNEWYTKPRYIEAARQVMGSIELDPASCVAANEIVKAERYYTKEQNGLDQEWRARSLWLNPPYGRTKTMKALGKSTIELFSTKLIEHYRSGDIEQAIFLGTCQINASWFYQFWQFPICFADHKVHFMSPDKHTNYAHMFGTSFIYLGPNEQRFIDVFSQFGHIVRAIGAPQSRPQQVTLEVTA
jgi:ParB family chromosome partitioning protein